MQMQCKFGKCFIWRVRVCCVMEGHDFGRVDISVAVGTEAAASPEKISSPAKWILWENKEINYISVLTFGKFWKVLTPGASALHVLADTVALTRIYSTSLCLQSLCYCYFEGLPTSQAVWSSAALGFLSEVDFTQTGTALFVPSEIKKILFFPQKES